MRYSTRGATPMGPAMMAAPFTAKKKKAPAKTAAKGKAPAKAASKGKC
jgi:hypothetical protein